MNKVKANIWFETLHRYVFDNYYVHDSVKHNETQIERLKLFVITKVYKFLCPFFEGWRYSLKFYFPKEKKYIRYEPKKSYLMNYEYNKLSKDLKIRYLEVKLKMKK